MNAASMYPMTEPVKRRYESARRQEQARGTRLRVIDAARDLFVAKGYGRTTMADVAQRAGVATETVYAAFRNKPALLRQVWYVGFRGDEEDVRLLDRSEIRAVLAEADLAAAHRAPGGRRERAGGRRHAGGDRRAAVGCGRALRACRRRDGTARGE